MKTKLNKLDFLISLYIFCLIVAELMGGKTFPIVNLSSIHLNASVAIFTLPLIFSINDVITEVYGPEKTRSIIRSGLIMISLLFVFSILAVSLPPSIRFQESEVAYDKIFSQSARISLASLIAFAISDFLDVLVFTKIRKKLGKKALWFRNNASNFIAQFIDTSLFMSLAFYSLDRSTGTNIAFLTSLIIPYWFLKSFMSIIETPFVYLGVKWLKNEKNNL